MLEFTYNTEFYKFHKFIFSSDKASYSVTQNYTSMQVDKISDRFVSLYTYDMMSQQTKFKMLIKAIELV